ncbi:MAG: IS630 family transposase [SAR324 cluster bacterium]|nr:IS630 family transposase [SAR324 cluster bacterium]
MIDKQKLDQLRNRRRHLKKQFKKSHSTRLSREIQRLNALIAYYKGLPSEMVAECYDISERSLQNWIQAFERYGLEELKDEERSGRPPKLSENQQAELKKMMDSQNQRIWVARHVYGAINTMCSVVYSVKYLPEFLRKLGLSFHKAVLNLVKKDSEKRRAWIQEKLPEIYQKKIAEGWRVFYQDEVGFAAEGTLGYTWGIKGKKTEPRAFDVSSVI